jgi:hypothetical protein
VRVLLAISLFALWLPSNGQRFLSARSEGLLPDSLTQSWHNRKTTDHHFHLRPFSPLSDPTLVNPADTGRGAQLSAGGLLALGGAVGDAAFVGIGAPFVGARISDGKKFYAEAGYMYWLESMPGHTARFADSTGVIPGIGFRDSIGPLAGAHLPVGRVLYRPNKFFEFEAGRGRHFWGDGHSSLMLGDHVTPYPYAQIHTRIWRVHFTNLYAYMRDVTGVNRWQEGRTKFMSMHALSWNVSRTVNLTFYEMVVWQTRDTMTNRGFEFNYLNPFILYRPLEFGLGSADNMLVGFSGRWQVRPSFQVYGQMLLDEFFLQEVRRRSGWWANKWAGQLGLKWHKPFGAPIHLLSEWALCRPFTYSHGSRLQNYGHMGQSIAHRLGTNFIEWTSAITHQRPKAEYSLEFIWAIFGRESEEKNWGGDIFKPYIRPVRQFGNEVAQGLKSTLHVTSLNMKFRPWNNDQIALTANIFHRFDKNRYRTENDLWFMVGFNLPLMTPMRGF